MEQLSLPYRIALISMVLIGAVWFIAMRPSDSSAPKTANAPGVKGLATAVDKAHQAAAASDASTAATENAANAGDGAATPAPSTAAPARQPASQATPAPHTHVHVTAKDRSAPLIADLKSGRVIVIGFAGTQAADDIGVRKALKGLDRHGGKVVVKTASIGDVSGFGAITRGVQVDHSPTVLVISSDMTARRVEGFTDAHELDQLVSDAVKSGAKKHS